MKRLDHIGILLLPAVLGLTGPATAKDLGVHGEVFPIAEPDILEVIRERLAALEASGEIARMNDAFRQRAIASARRPAPVEGIARTLEERSWTLDPTLVVEEDITDDKGRLIHAAGTRVNPLDVLPLTQKLLFIDGDDPAQVGWAMEQHQRLKGRAKIVLIKGAPLDLGETHRIPFYFDQRGLLTTRFAIRQVPAVVEQDGALLRVSEVFP